MPHIDGHVILGRDINIPLDRALDKSNTHQPTLKHTPKQSNHFAQLLYFYDLIGIWRDLNPTV